MSSVATTGQKQSMLPKQSGLRAPVTGMRPPSARAPALTTESPKSGLKAPEPTGIAAPRSISSNRSPQAMQRSTLPRLSSKNSDAHSSDSSSEGGSQRTTPVARSSPSPPVGIPQPKSSIAK